MKMMFTETRVLPCRVTIQLEEVQRVRISPPRDTVAQRRTVPARDQHPLTSIEVTARHAAARSTPRKFGTILQLTNNPGAL